MFKIRQIYLHMESYVHESYDERFLQGLNFSI